MKRRKSSIPKWSLLAQAVTRRRLSIECDGIPYRFESASSPRWKNWFLTEISAQLRLAKPLGLPTHLQVEPTNRCNLSCVVCPGTTGELRRPRGAMGAIAFEKLMSEIGDSLLLLLLWEWGEPFLNDDLCEIIAAAKARQVKVVTSTNGHFVHGSAKAREIVDSGLDTLVFALDGATPDSYREYRQGGQFERVVENIRLVAETKKAMGAKNPFLVLQFIVMRHNEAQISSATDLARQLGVDVLSLRTANPYRHEFETNCLPQDPRYRKFQYLARTGERKRKPNRCKRFWNMPAVQWDGTITHCEFDINGEFKLGNVFQSPFREIWQGSSYCTARHFFSRRRPITQPCLNCMYNYCDVQDIIADVIPISGAYHLRAKANG